MAGSGKSTCRATVMNPAGATSSTAVLTSALRFRGGHGFTAVRAHRVEWRRAWYRGYTTCREGGEYLSGSGKVLQVQAGARATKVRRFFAYLPQAGARVEFEAFDSETVGPVEVKRSTWTYAAPKTFTSSPDFAAATIAPPVPLPEPPPSSTTKATAAPGSAT